MDLLEQPRVQGLTSDTLTLHGYEIATVLIRLNMPQVLEADHTVLAPDAEAAQPLYARYWLHNRGPAFLGGLPAVAHLHPQHMTVEPNSRVPLRLTVSSDSSDAALHGKVRLLCANGWSADPAELSFVLPPGEHLETDVVLTMSPDVPQGLYPVRAELAVTGSDAASMPPAWRQVVEDVCVVSVAATADADVLRLISDPEPVNVSAGETARLAVTVGTDAHADLAVEAHLISPWGTWEWMGPAAVGRELPARGTVELGFDVAPPVWVEPGEYGVDPASAGRPACLLARGEGDRAMSSGAKRMRIARPCGDRRGVPVWVDEVDAREDRLRACRLASPPRRWHQRRQAARRWRRCCGDGACGGGRRRGWD